MGPRPTRLPNRVPPLWIVVVPALVLVAFALRAAWMERGAASERARDRAREAAERLARSVETVAREFGEGLVPSADARTEQEVLDAAPHLVPRWVLTPDGTPWVGGAPPAADADARAYAVDALDAAARLADEPAGPEAAAAFLEAAADAGPPAAGDVLRAVGAAAAMAAGERSLDGDAPALFDRVASDASGIGPEIRDRALSEVTEWFGGELPPRLRAVIGRWDALREMARFADEGDPPSVRLVGRPGGVSLLVLAPVRVVAAGAAHDASPIEARLAGEVPSATLRARVESEAEALAATPGIAMLDLVAPDGTASVRAGEAPAGAFVESSAALRNALDGWRVHAVAPVGDEGRAAVVVLASAVVLAKLVLLAGAWALRRAAAEQARLAAERQTFLDHVAHEVRTPAGALLALSEELAAGHVPAPRQPTYHAHLAEESRRLARLVEDTLDLSRLDAGRLVLDRRETDLRAIVHEGLRAAGAEGRVTFRAPTEPVTVLADAAAVRRVVRNLVDNAIRHGGAGERPEVTVSADAASARVTVRDHGPGVAPDHAERVFDRFWRAPSETHETKGVGVGLAICREIALAHGGDVTLEPTDGKGATFALVLPRGGGNAG